MSITAEMTAPQKTQLLQGKTALVTGAGSGIGRAAALAMAASGADVCLVDLKENNAEKVKAEIEKLGTGSAIVADVDISDPKRMEGAFKSTMDRYGRLDVVFANAGINGLVSPIEDFPVDEWEHTISTNLGGTFHAVKYAVPHMKKNGGSIIITSSINGNRIFSSFGMSAYSTSKAGQVAFMKMAALELARYHIRVNAICPGAIRTNIGESTHPVPELDKIKLKVQYPDGRQPLEHKPGEPEEVAKLALFLASDESSRITGTEVYIDGAESLL